MEDPVGQKSNIVTSHKPSENEQGHEFKETSREVCGLSSSFFGHFQEYKFQSFLGTLVSASYMPEDYHTDVVVPLQEAGIEFMGSVHVECMPDQGIAEAKWVKELPGTTVKAIVASCDLSQPSAGEELEDLVSLGDRVKGIRWILDYDIGPFNGGKNPTHVAVTRHTTHGAYLRANGGRVWKEWERGFAMLEKYGLSFDLQCAPTQLEAAAELIARYPNIPVVIDHLGKPRAVIKPDGSVDTEEINRWRAGMTVMAALPNVHCKISMLGYAVPGWCQGRIEVVQDLVRETVRMFGPDRCMVGLNWWKDAATSDSDGLSSIGPSPQQFLEHCANKFFVHFSEEDLQKLFCGTAQKFRNNTITVIARPTI